MLPSDDVLKPSVLLENLFILSSATVCRSVTFMQDKVINVIELINVSALIWERLHFGKMCIGASSCLINKFLFKSTKEAASPPLFLSHRP